MSEDLYGYAVLNVRSPKAEIGWYVERNNLRVSLVRIKGCPKMLGFSKKGDKCVFGLWKTPMDTSIRKLKKRVKKFLRQYEMISKK